MSVIVSNMNIPSGCQKCKFFKKYAFGNGLDYSYSCILGAFFGDAYGAATEFFEGSRENYKKIFDENALELYKEKSIYILHYPSGEQLSVSFGFGPY